MPECLVLYGSTCILGHAMQYEKPFMSVNSVYQTGKRNLVPIILVIVRYDFHFMLSYSLLAIIKKQFTTMRTSSDQMSCLYYQRQLQRLKHPQNVHTLRLFSATTKQTPEGLLHCFRSFLSAIKINLNVSKNWFENSKLMQYKVDFTVTFIS